jgi:hypothetical protein
VRLSPGRDRIVFAMYTLDSIALRIGRWPQAGSIRTAVGRPVRRSALPAPSGLSPTRRMGAFCKLPRSSVLGSQLTVVAMSNIDSNLLLLPFTQWQTAPRNDGTHGARRQNLPACCATITCFDVAWFRHF